MFMGTRFGTEWGNQERFEVEEAVSLSIVSTAVVIEAELRLSQAKVRFSLTSEYQSILLSKCRVVKIVGLKSMEKCSMRISALHGRYRPS